MSTFQQLMTEIDELYRVASDEMLDTDDFVDLAMEKIEKLKDLADRLKKEL